MRLVRVQPMPFSGERCLLEARCRGLASDQVSKRPGVWSMFVALFIPARCIKEPSTVPDKSSA